MKNVVNEGLKSTGVLCVWIGMAAGRGSASTTHGSARCRPSPATASTAGAPPAARPASGGPKPEKSNAILKEHTRELKACYDREKDRGMAYEGDTKFRVKVDPGGKVTDVQGVDTPPAGEFLSSCVTEQMKSWKFPSSGGGSLLNFPVNW